MGWLHPYPNPAGAIPTLSGQGGGRAAYPDWGGVGGALTADARRTGRPDNIDRTAMAGKGGRRVAL